MKRRYFDISKLSDLAYKCAPYLLGKTLISCIDGEQVAGMIVEVEAYEQTDPASHSYNGQTVRNSPMFGPPGQAYVYFTYGMHYCFNIVTGELGHGSAVLIRAVEPTQGIDIMTVRRGKKLTQELTNGPAKLCQAFAINKEQNEHNLQSPPLWIEDAPAIPNTKIVHATRIGIKENQQKLWRYYIKDNAYVSKK